MWELDHKESWAPKNWCFWTMMVEKTLESPLNFKDIKPVNPKGNQSRIVIVRSDAKAEAPILRPPEAKNWLLWKDPDAGKDWRQEEKGTRGWDGWMASPTRWTWVWASSGSWWRTGKPGVLQSMGSQIRTQLSNWTELNFLMLKYQKWNPSFSLCPVSQLLSFLSLLDFKILAHSPFYTLYNLDPNSCSLWFTGHSVS